MQQSETYKYIPFQFLWLIIIVPKAIQLILLLIIATVLYVNSERRCYFDSISILFYLTIAIQFLAVIANIQGQESNRIFAAFNTMILWVIALLFYGFYKNISIDMNKIYKYCFYNIMILMIISALVFVMINTNHAIPLILGRDATAIDWLSGEESARLTAYMEYSNVIVTFYLLQIPFAFRFMVSHFRWPVTFILLLSSIFPVFQSHSRAGQVVAVVCVGVIIAHTISYKKKIWIPTITIGSIAALFTAFFMQDRLMLVIQNILQSREGSTSMREAIYKTSISMTLRNSPIIGEGIKSKFYSFPLGSHSTYIGMFYKTGFLGCTFALIGLIMLFIVVFKASMRGKYGLITLSCFACLLAFFVFEDVDGTNWSLVLFWSSIALQIRDLKRTANEDIDGEQFKSYQLERH